jgi:formate dehydrogenase (coenzyme F420) beta subunit
MNEQWLLETHGDPLGKIRDLIKVIWTTSNLDGMLVTLSAGDDLHAKPTYITDLDQVDKINPFKPLMEMNAAILVPGFFEQYPTSRLAALLRPCEMRALTEMTKHTQLNLDNLLTISVDCLGTLPADEYQWRLERAKKASQINNPKLAEPVDELANEAIQYARQGGIVPYRYRSACQVCNSPASSQADLNIHILGLPIRQQMLVEYKRSAKNSQLHLEGYFDGKADESLMYQHARIMSKMDERHQHTMERIEEGLGSMLPKDVDAVILQLENCGECQSCLDVCPICSIDRPVRNQAGHYDRSDIMRWLVSCAGCGMCEQACPDHLPISSIFAHIRQKLAEQWEYSPGRSVDEHLPIMQ